MAVLVITIGSIGIAGIPGTSTMAASVGLSGTGLGGYFSFITPILAIDPIYRYGKNDVECKWLYDKCNFS